MVALAGVRWIRRRASSVTLRQTTSAIARFGRLRQWQAALDLLGTVDARDVVLLSAAMTACTRGLQWQRALCLAQGCRESERTTFMFNCLIRACSEGQHWRGCLEYFEEMQSRRCQPSSVSYNLLLTGCEKSENWESVLGIFEEMRGRSLQRDVIIFNTTASACERRHFWQQALSLVASSFDEQVQPDQMLCATAVAASGRSQQWQLVAQVLEDMRAVPKGFGGCHAAVMAFSRCNWQMSLAELEEMQRWFFVPDKAAYSAASRACAGASEWQMALAVGEEARSAGLSLDESSLEEIAAARRGVRPAGHNDIAAEQRPGVLDPQCYENTIEACARSRQWQVAVHLVAEMREASLEPHAATMAQVSEVMVREDQFPGAMALYRGSQDLGCGAKIDQKGLVDLHGLCLEVAQMAVCTATLDAAIGLHGNSLRSLDFIVGLGHNSDAGERVVAPAVLQMLEDLGLFSSEGEALVRLPKHQLVAFASSPENFFGRKSPRFGRRGRRGGGAELESCSPVRCAGSVETFRALAVPCVRNAWNPQSGVDHDPRQDPDPGLDPKRDIEAVESKGGRSISVCEASLEHAVAEVGF
ncbi:unnamed protein product [Effrenium voratum]|uniref:Pentatricopeptide repeat-containing protein, chloroplastic n=1 Tax=Effrenium voratum TaxID=2562239 RepID=A0AA36JMH4_9DINO|nr:unnamed protein product [Effrenium voratum]